MADLWWLKFDIAAWLKLTQNLTPHEHHGFVYLVLAAWSEPGDASVPACSLVDDDEQLMRTAKLTKAEWRAAAPALRRIFAPIPDADGRLRSPIVWGWYQKAQGRHASAVPNGGKGGTAPTQPGKRRGRPRKNDPLGHGNSQQNSDENSDGNSQQNSDENRILRYSGTQREFPPAASQQGGEIPRGADAARAPSGAASSPADEPDAPNGAGPTDRPSLVELAAQVAAELSPPTPGRAPLRDTLLAPGGAWASDPTTPAVPAGAKAAHHAQPDDGAVALLEHPEPQDGPGGAETP